jgi:hypothetical protein
MSRALVPCLIAAAMLTAAPVVRAQPAQPALPDGRESDGTESGGEIDRYEPQATEFERQLKESARDLEAKHRLVSALLLALGGALVLFMLALLWMAVRSRRSARRGEQLIEELLAANRRTVELLEALTEEHKGRKV